MPPENTSSENSRPENTPPEATPRPGDPTPSTAPRPEASPPSGTTSSGPTGAAGTPVIRTDPAAASAPGSTPLLSVRGLQKIYDTDSGGIEAVRDLTFDLGKNELVCLVGPSGSGKTTLLKCIAGLLAPTSGTVELDGKTVTGPPKKMAVVFQEYGRSLFPWLRVEGNVELPLKNAGVPKVERKKLVAEALESVGLSHAGRQYPWQLSGGMQQRVAIARAIAYQPEILLMDEPFAAVDAQTRADLEDLVRSIRARLGVTVLFVTHDIDESVYLGSRVIMLSSSPTVVQEDIAIDLPEHRDQLETRALPRFTELRHHVYEQIQLAKEGFRPDATHVDGR